jgi:regulator of replication initiation timing
MFSLVFVLLLESSMKRILYVVLTIGFYLSFVVLIQLTKDYPCIDSTFVKKLDVLSINKSAGVYACSMHKAVDFSQTTNDYVELVEGRLNQLGLILEKIQPLKTKLQISVDENNPLKFEIKENQIRIGKNLLIAKGHLELAVIRSWLQGGYAEDERVKLFNQSLADLIYYATFGRLDGQDPVTELYPEIGLARWPQVLKNLDVYCESAWKSPEDFERCASLDQLDHNRRELLTMSLRPLLTSSLIDAFNSLSRKEQNNFLQDIPQLVAERSVDSQLAIEALLNQDNSLKEGLSILKVFAEQFSLRREASYPQRRFIARLNQYLQSHGVVDSFAEAYFDLVIEIPDHIKTSSPLFKSLEAAAKQNLNLQIAVKDLDQLWILPSRSSLSLKIFDRVKVRQHVFFACPILKEIEVAQFMENSEKLLMIKGCDSERPYAFDMLFKYGAQEFTKIESQLAFIQFHLPSLQQRMNELQHIKNFFELVQNRDVTRREFQLLGWQDVQWNEKYQFYKPKAAIDAIEFFRVESEQKSN